MERVPTRFSVLFR